MISNAHAQITLPPAKEQKPNPATTTASKPLEPNVNVVLPDSGRSTWIGVVVVVVIAVLLIYVRRMYAESLVRAKRSPRQAGAAGTALYLWLLSWSTAIVVWLVGGSDIAFIIAAVILGGIGLVCLLWLLFASRLK